MVFAKWCKSGEKAANHNRVCSNHENMTQFHSCSLDTFTAFCNEVANSCGARMALKVICTRQEIKYNQNTAVKLFWKSNKSFLWIHAFRKSVTVAALFTLKHAIETCRSWKICGISHQPQKIPFLPICKLYKLCSYLSLSDAVVRN